MHRILLVIDDYSELVYLQTLLKKIGFDVDGIQNPRKFDEKRLTMNPELVIATARGKNVNGLSLTETMKRRGGKPKNILLIPQAMAEKLKGLKLKNVESTLMSPVEPITLIETISDILGTDKTVLAEKYERMKLTLDPDNESDIQLLRQVNTPKAGEGRESQTNSEPAKPHESTIEPRPSSSVQERGPNQSELSAEFPKKSSLTDAERNQRMQVMLDSMEAPEHDGFPRDVVSRENTRLRQEENERVLADLEDERKAFVRSMFKKAADE